MKALAGSLAGLLIFSLSYGETVRPVVLDLYRNTAFLIQEGSFKLDRNTSTVLNLPSFTDLQNTAFFLKPEECILTQVLELPVPEKDTAVERLEERIKGIESRLKAVEKEIFLLEKVSLKGEEGVFSFLGRFSQYYSKKVIEKKELEEKLKKLKEELEKTRKAKGKSYRLSVNCPSPVYGSMTVLSKVPAKADQKYILSADSLNGKLTITSRVYVSQQTGTDLKNITVRYHSYHKTGRLEPPPPYTPRPILKSPPIAPMERGKRQEVSYVETPVKVYFQVDGVNLPDGKEAVLTVVKDTYPASFSVFIDGYGTITPFMKATFKPDRYYPSSFKGEYYIDGVFAGKGRFPSVEKGKENTLYFGEDIFVSVSKEKIKDFTEETFFGKLETKKEWKYTITNRHKKQMKITVADKLPVSTSEKVKVKPFSSLKWKRIDEKGIVYWEFTLSPAETKTFNFGYTVIREK
ncbi:MAG: DUF4139 domain-containing protein [Aquificae bacterium]|nr:DUF4139 domain-containing protein [Aquificota bacterium]